MTLSVSTEGDDDHDEREEPRRQSHPCRIDEGKLPMEDGASLLGLSERQLWRLHRAVGESGSEAQGPGAQGPTVPLGNTFRTSPSWSIAQTDNDCSLGIGPRGVHRDSVPGWNTGLGPTPRPGAEARRSNGGVLPLRSGAPGHAVSESVARRTPREGVAATFATIRGTGSA